MKTSYKTSVAENALHRMIESLYRLFIVCKHTSQAISKKQETLQQLEQANQDYVEILNDHREKMKQYWSIILMILACAIDSIIAGQAMAILCELFGFPQILKYLVPAILVTVEIGISYLQALKLREGTRLSWIMRAIPYLVLFILVGFSILTITYNIQSYSPQFDGANRTVFIITTCIIQGMLLVASILMHLWLIVHSEDLAESINFFLFKRKHEKLSKDIVKMEAKNKNENIKRFTRDSQRFVQEYDRFHREQPQSGIDFTRTMPNELVKAVNMVMGKPVLALEHPQS